MPPDTSHHVIKTLTNKIGSQHVILVTTRMMIISCNQIPCIIVQNLMKTFKFLWPCNCCTQYRFRDALAECLFLLSDLFRRRFAASDRFLGLTILLGTIANKRHLLLYLLLRRRFTYFSQNFCHF